MLKVLFGRIMTTIPALIGVVVVSFLLTRVLPGDTAAYFAGPAATPQAIEEVKKKLGLDRPLPEQFRRYVVDLSHGDLGQSLTTGQPVVADLKARLPASAELTLFGLILSLLIAVPLGILAAVKQDLSSITPAALLRLPAFRCLCSSPACCSSISSISSGRSRQRRSDAWMSSPVRHPPSPAFI
jgi:ABC-type dipeptide/oligopeptide/nickel transport system permease component